MAAVIPGSYQRRPVRRRRRHSHKVYVRRQILALVVCIVVIFAVLFGIDRLVRLAVGGHHQPTASQSTGKGHHTHRPTPTTTTTLPAAAPGGNAVSLSAVGSLILGLPGVRPPDPAGYLVNVQSVMANPIVIGNLEGALTDATTSICDSNGKKSPSCRAFSNPPAYANYLHQAGFNVLSSANAHSHDFGTQGVTDTSNALKDAGIAQTGLTGQIAVTSDRHTKVAVIGFSPFHGTNDVRDLATAKSLIQQARSLAPVVIVYMDAGASGPTVDHVTGHEEKQGSQNRGNPEQFAHAAINDGASAVVASGNRVVRGMEFYKGHLIAYGLGDFAGYDNFSVHGNLDMAGIVKLTLSGAGAFERASWVSLLLNTQGQPNVDTTGQAAVFVNQLSREDFGAAAAKVEPDGSIVPVNPSAASSPTSTTPASTSPPSTTSSGETTTTIPATTTTVPATTTSTAPST